MKELLLIIVATLISMSCSCILKPLKKRNVKEYDVIFLGTPVEKHLNLTLDSLNSIIKNEMNNDRVEQLVTANFKEQGMIMNSVSLDLYKFEVVEYFKCDRSTEYIWVQTPSDSGLCGTSFKVKDEYIVFIKRTTKGNYSTSSCSYNKHFENESIDFNLIQKLRRWW